MRRTTKPTSMKIIWMTTTTNTMKTMAQPLLHRHQLKQLQSTLTSRRLRPRRLQQQQVLLRWLSACVTHLPSAPAAVLSGAVGFFSTDVHASANTLSLEHKVFKSTEGFQSNATMHFWCICQCRAAMGGDRQEALGQHGPAPGMLCHRVQSQSIAAIVTESHFSW